MALQAFSQEVETEKTYEISRKSKRGFLAGIDFDKDAKTYQLTYITKQTERKLKYEFYKFDNDFNFLADGEGEEKFETMKTKFTWFKFKDLYYAVEGVTVENNLTGTLVLKRKRTNYTYDFYSGGYKRVVTVAEKLKPKNDDGRSLTLVTYAEDDKTGDVLVLAGVKSKKKSETNTRPNDLILFRFNKDLDIVAQTTVPFEQWQAFAGAKILYEKNEEDPENPGVASISVVFYTSTDRKGKPTYTYLKLGADTKINQRFTFDGLSSFWKIDEFIYDYDKGDMYVFGPSSDEQNKFTAGKYSAVELLKVNNGGTKDYFTQTKIEEFSAKLKTPPTQKKSPEYSGKKFEFSNYKVASNGDLFVSGQNFKIDASGKDQGTKNFKDIMGFHFSDKGVLKAQYGVDTKENGKEANDNGTPQEFIEGRDGNMFWLLREIKDYNANYNKLLTYPRLAKVTPDATITDFLTLGKSEGYYLDPKYPYLETDKGNRLVFFGANKSGKSLWFCKVKLN